ncbi:hypothetical protein SLEP1_g57344 [Rubroshorea leprosula]|uniref:Uncharacterized protein n=1 Tax=Rubroshorea leprosula TaxID=152421 RepID=A0AAV5MP83_9ROSI|nr:hypothetical protein SLEP1_g57344 [Rubroshorea leprosula]
MKLDITKGIAEKSLLISMTSNLLVATTSQRWYIPQTTLRHLHHTGKSNKQGHKHKLEIGYEIEEFLALKGHKGDPSPCA